ncbi:D-alanyl-D-alanine carboxypeptidase family protein [Streptomyces sp. NPDC091377]|uniref:D-alanyl-D-alanine carboxypeptidase family protein n=1 Tax=Streptomyces sp. NPDC091377 TaxID=3365995 RepID=UPI00380A9415
MTIGFSSRKASVGAGASVTSVASVSCALCVVGVLALAPAAVAAQPGADPLGPGRSALAPHPSQLYRPGTQVRPRAGAPGVPEVSALSWLIADARSGEVLAAHDAHRRLPPASTLKTLFALTVLPVLPSGIEHEVGDEELLDVGPGSSLVGVQEGVSYHLSDLWRGVFLSSGNDAVRVLAGLNGGWRATSRQMQEKARSLGARDTRVTSPDGYDSEGQVSSAYDLAIFGRAGLRNADFAGYCRTLEAKFPAGGGWTFPIRNTNRLLTGDDGVEPYEGLLGIKNGYTSNAGYTLVTGAHRGSRTLVVTVMNPQDGNPSAVYEEARSLLDWGFDAAGRVDPVGSLDALRARPRSGPDPVPVARATTAPEESGPGWLAVWTVLGAAGAGAGAVALALRLAGVRVE